MKIFLFALFVLFSEVQCEQRANHGEFTESLLNTQKDLSAVHMYFQVQLSLITANFDRLLQSLSDSILPDLTDDIEEFNDMSAETTAELANMNAHPSCLAEWEDIQMSFGRSLSSCAEIGAYEISWMLNYHIFLTWYAEYYTNMVAMEGLEAFTYWSPLTNSGFDINKQINLDLGYILNDFLSTHYAELEWFESYIYDYFYSIGYRSYFCSYSTIGRFYSETVNIINDAKDGMCSAW